MPHNQRKPLLIVDAQQWVYFVNTPTSSIVLTLHFLYDEYRYMSEHHAVLLCL